MGCFPSKQLQTSGVTILGSFLGGKKEDTSPSYLSSHPILPVTSMLFSVLSLIKVFLLNIKVPIENKLIAQEKN